MPAYSLASMTFSSNRGTWAAALVSHLYLYIQSQHDCNLSVLHPPENYPPATPANPSSSTADPNFLEAPTPQIAKGSQSAVTLKRPRVHSIGEAGLDPSSVKKPKSGTTIGELKTKFPQLNDRVVWAKGHFRSLCLLRQPYPLSAQRLTIAAECFTLSLEGKTLQTYDNPPDEEYIFKLVSPSH